MTAVVNGVDAAKRPHSTAVFDERENQLAPMTVINDSAGYRDTLRLAKRWPACTWVVEAAGGVGEQQDQRLTGSTRSGSSSSRASQPDRWR